MQENKLKLYKYIRRLKRAGFTPVYAEEGRECLPNSYKWVKRQEFLTWKPGKFEVIEGYYPKKSGGGWKNPVFKVSETEGDLPKGFKWRSKSDGSLYALEG